MKGRGQWGGLSNEIASIEEHPHINCSLTENHLQGPKEPARPSLHQPAASWRPPRMATASFERHGCDSLYMLGFTTPYVKS